MPSPVFFLKALLALMMWSAVILGKAGGGGRLICLFPCLVRVWEGMRSETAPEGRRVQERAWRKQAQHALEAATRAEQAAKMQAYVQRAVQW